MKAPDHFSNIRFRAIVEEFVQGERDRRIMIRKYADKLTMEKIAEEEDLSVTQVKRIIARHYFIVFGMMEEK